MEIQSYMKDYRKLLTELAGECATMTESFLRGWISSLLHNNNPKFDILSFNQGTD